MNNRSLMILLMVFAGVSMTAVHPGEAISEAPFVSGDQTESMFDFDFENDPAFMKMIEEIQDKVAEVEQSMPQETRDQLEAKQKIMDDLSQKIADLRQKAADEQAKMDELIQEAAQLEEEKNEHKLRVKDLREQVERLLQDKKDLAKALDHASKKVSENVEAEEQEEEEDDSLSEMHEELAEVEAELKEAETELEQVRAVKRGVKHRWKQQKEEVAKAEGRSSQAAKELHDAEEKMKNEENAIDELTKDYQGAFMKALLPEGMEDLDFESLNFGNFGEEDSDSNLLQPAQYGAAAA